MGMPSRKFVLLGVAGLGGLFVLADQTLLSKVSASISDLGGMVEQAKKVQAIAGSLDSGDPNALQGLLESLATEQGLTPGEADESLFSLASFFPDESAPADSLDEASILEGVAPGGGNAAPQTAPLPSHRVTMVMTSPSGGCALINGTPLREGETQDGLTLLAVREDGVSVREGDVTRFLALR